MKRKRRSAGLAGFAVFVVLLLISGYALNAAGYDDNPFDEIAFLSNWTNGGEERFAQEFRTNDQGLDVALSNVDDTQIDLTALSTTDSRFELPPLSELDSDDADAATDSSFVMDMPDQAGRGERGGIAWSDVGDVLYNFWFIGAVTAVFIVVQQVFKFSLKQFKRRLPRTAAAH